MSDVSACVRFVPRKRVSHVGRGCLDRELHFFLFILEEFSEESWGELPGVGVFSWKHLDPEVL